MSIEKGESRGSERREFGRQSQKIQGSYTEEGFYRSKNNHQPSMNLSNLSQKQSVYDHKVQVNAIHTASDIGYTTLNPSKYEVGSAELGQQQQYEVLAVFELNRQREKNRILEKRLLNKEVHIQKMKQVHNELTEAFQKCQAQLQYYKRKSAQPVDVREYVEQINELKHLVIRLQDKITEYEKRENKRYNSVKQEENGQNSSGRRNISNFKVGGDDSDRVHYKKEKRSKTVANQQEGSPEFKKLNILEEYVVKYPNRITNFISQFMAMVECFSREAQNAKLDNERNHTKRRLKIGWKWIKEVVVQWNHYKNYGQKARYFHNRLRKIFNVPDSADDEQIMDIILTAIES